MELGEVSEARVRLLQARSLSPGDAAVIQRQLTRCAEPAFPRCGARISGPPGCRLPLRRRRRCGCGMSLLAGMATG